MIYHITNKKEIEEAKAKGEYSGDTLATQGFIHNSTIDQVLEIANSRFLGRTDLVLLQIDESKVKPELKYELAKNGKEYPHIFGPLNIDAVVKVFDFLPGHDGSFKLPGELNLL
jgi:uncharacterized protein (DUF952 family)